MTTPKLKTHEFNETKFKDEKYVNKLKSWSDKVGLTIEEIKEKKISKNQLKKMFKQKLFKSMQSDLRKKHREKQKLRKRRQIEKNVQLPIKFTKMDQSENKMKIVIDMSHVDLMSQRELQKTFKQVQRCYSINRRTKEPCQIYITSFDGKIKNFFLDKNFVNKWDIHLIEQHWYDYFKSTDELSKIVYLTPDSEQTLPQSEQLFAERNNLIFIIGGLVDHNAYKNLTFQIANEKSVQTGKFPIDEHIKMAASKVLSINQVFEIMLDVSIGISWQKTLNDNVPLRKTAFHNKSKQKTDVQDTEQAKQSNGDKSLECDQLIVKNVKRSDLNAVQQNQPALIDTPFKEQLN